MSKTILITGGSRGLGKNMALSLADQGNNIILTYHSNEAEANSVANEIKYRGQKADVLQFDVADFSSYDAFEEDVEASLDKMGVSKLDYIINNAGTGCHAMFGETAVDQFDRMVNEHYKGPYFLTQRLLPHMNDGGGIINISSGLARFALPGNSAYGSAKAAIETVTRYQAKELGPRGIRSNVVAPGAIETDFGGGVIRDNEEINQQVASNTALGRAGLPDDIGGVVAFLCSDDAKWINAQVIEVSGGMML